MHIFKSTNINTFQFSNISTIYSLYKMAFQVKNILISVILILLLVGCKHNYTTNTTILKAESMLYTLPDSANKLLNSIKNPEKLSKADYAAWCLNLTHAQFKLYLDIKSDSLIKVAVDYYDNTNLKLYSGTAYYLWGCVAELNYDEKKAMYAYKKGNDLLSTMKNSDKQSIRIKGLINYRISNLFLANEYNNESEKNINIAIEMFELLKDTKYLAYCHRIKAEILYRQEKPIPVILNEADICQNLALKDSSIDLYNNILTFKGKILISDNIIEAKNTLLKSYSTSNINQQELFSLLTYVYAKLSMPDSAKYFQKLVSIENNDLNRVLISELSKSYVYLHENNKDSAFHSFENAYNLREKIYKENIKEQLVRIDKQYDLSKKEGEKAKLEIKNQKNIILIAFLSILVLAILLILLFITNINKKRQAELIIEKQQLEFEVKTKQVENDKKLKILHSNLENKIDNTLQFKKLQTNFSKAERKEEFISDITRRSVLTNIEWQFYIYEANELFEGKILKLREQYPQLTDSDMNVIALICLGIDIGNSIILLDYSSFNTMYIRRTRIKNHLGLDKNTDLERWLKERIAIEK